MTKGRRKWTSQPKQREKELTVPRLFCSFWALKGLDDAPCIAGEGVRGESALFSGPVAERLSSPNALAVLPRKNVSAAIWASRGLVKVTQGMGHHTPAGKRQSQAPTQTFG